MAAIFGPTMNVVLSTQQDGMWFDPIFVSNIKYIES